MSQVVTLESIKSQLGCLAFVIVFCVVFVYVGPTIILVIYGKDRSRAENESQVILTAVLLAIFCCSCFAVYKKKKSDLYKKYAYQQRKKDTEFMDLENQYAFLEKKD